MTVIYNICDTMKIFKFMYLLLFSIFCIPIFFPFLKIIIYLFFYFHKQFEKIDACSDCIIKLLSFDILVTIDPTLSIVTKIKRLLPYFQL